MIYMIGGVGVVKIGMTNDPVRRLGTLQTGHARPLKIMRLFEGGAAEEASLHAMFADVRTKGEWFSFVPEMLGDVGLVEIPAVPKTLRNKPPHPVLPEPPRVDPGEGFEAFKEGLTKAFGSLENATRFMDLSALPWISARLGRDVEA